MIGLEDRQALARDIHTAHTAGTRLKPACEIVGIDLRTLQRWQAADGLVSGDGRPQAARPVPSHALSDAERAHLLAVANEPRFASVPPARIVPMLADEGKATTVLAMLNWLGVKLPASRQRRQRLCRVSVSYRQVPAGIPHQVKPPALPGDTYSLIAHVPFKTAQAVSDTMISLLTPFAASVHTLTTDNGKEFAQHERIAEELDADFFFAHPYASWERGANENMNGLIRQFFPKKMCFDSITHGQVAFAMHRLNHRPRKCLGFKTPHEVFMMQLHSHHNAVALQT